jgi:Calcineurin-like phosphoesterase superfamily domain
VIAEMAEFTREALGAERIAWLNDLPMMQKEGPAALVHASPASTWIAPGAKATEDELDAVYAQLGSQITVYGHIHHPYVRRAGQRSVANSGSVSLSCDGDARASYLLIDQDVPAIRRVEYDLAAEVRALRASGIPHAEWVVRSLEAASFVMP